MFSIIIPLYNKADYIMKTVNSLLNQMFTEFELIIVNDGSTDNGLEVVGAIHDDRIRIVDQKNAGVSTARNNGVKSAKYDLCCGKFAMTFSINTNNQFRKTEKILQKTIIKNERHNHKNLPQIQNAKN
jgi:GT2 family glycosyltransferase